MDKEEEINTELFKGKDGKKSLNDMVDFVQALDVDMNGEKRVEREPHDA